MEGRGKCLGECTGNRIHKAKGLGRKGFAGEKGKGGEKSSKTEKPRIKDAIWGGGGLGSP